MADLRMAGRYHYDGHLRDNEYIRLQVAKGLPLIFRRNLTHPAARSICDG